MQLILVIIHRKWFPDSLENVQANEVADAPKNVDRHNSVKFNSESDQETCSEASKTISLFIGPTISHLTYTGKMTHQKKSYGACVVN